MRKVILSILQNTAFLHVLGDMLSHTGTESRRTRSFPLRNTASGTSFSGPFPALQIRLGCSARALASVRLRTLLFPGARLLVFVFEHFQLFLLA